MADGVSVGLPSINGALQPFSPHFPPQSLRVTMHSLILLAGRAGAGAQGENNSAGPYRAIHGPKRVETAFCI